MSRGFVKEDDQEEAPFIPPRAELPDGMPNHVTPRGLKMLHEERGALEAERANITGSENERRRAQAELDGRLALLNECIMTAHVVEPPSAQSKEVRFGSTVTFEHRTGRLQGTRSTFTIVGVDEAEVKTGRIAFTSPLARALMGKRKGGVAALTLDSGELRVKVLEVQA